MDCPGLSQEGLQPTPTEGSITSGKPSTSLGLCVLIPGTGRRMAPTQLIWLS